MNYDSQAIDGESGSTNNQPSAIGDGWSLGGGGFIERSYVPCSQDTNAVAASGDQCWKTDNATISFGGHSGRLVRDTSSGTWRLQSDDGSRIEHLVGAGQGCAANGTYDSDCWRVTTTDGTQYWFGLNQLPGWTSGKPTTNSAWTTPVFGNDAAEPCHGSTFAASWCQQAWRWNLDYVVDVHGNAQALYYNAETNSYAVNGTAATSYVRGGQLDHIDYGFISGNAYAANAASAKVSFGYAAKGRCSDATGNGCTAQSLNGPATAPTAPANYPDVPFDQHCVSGCSGLISPTFWTTAMLSTVATSVLKSGAYQQVDSWSLGHAFPDPGDTTKPVLWLTKIGHTGTSGGSISEPDTVFTGIPMQNRVWVKDGLAPLDKYRISSIQTSLGAIISVNYSSQECTPSNAAAIQADLPNNNHRCFPQWWTPQVAYPAAPQLDLFHKYVVTSVVADPHTGGGQDQPQETNYIYTGTPAWRYDTSSLTPDTKRTWSQYAGYDTIEVREGSAGSLSQQVATQYSFFRGLDGDRASTSGGTKTVYVTGSSTVRDSLWFAGQVRQTKKLVSVGGAALTTTVSTPWASNITANDGINQARNVQTSDTTTTSTTSTGATQTSSLTKTFDVASGLELTSRDAATGTPTTCTVTSYAPSNSTVWLIGLVSERRVVAVDCNALASAVYPAAAVSDIKTSYDGSAWGATPTKGDVTATQAVKKYTGTTASTAQWITTSQTAYDSMGRSISSTDALNRTDSTAYTPAAGAAAGSGGLTSMVATNALGWTSSTTLDPAWGVQTKLTDVNGSVTSATYDALGRVTGVWYPSNLQTTNPTQPNAAYTYTLAQNAANVVQTDTLTPSVIVTSYALFDGLGREIQTQAPAEGSGTVVTDKWYDTLGRNWSSNNPYWASVSTSGTQFVPSTQSQVPSQTITSYDGAGRITSTALNSLGAERYRTTHEYQGSNRVDTTPPTGATPTSDITDARGNRTSLVQYLAAAISTTAPKQTTTYAYDPRNNMTSMTDPAGNAWSWTFDALNRQASAADPDSGNTLRTYDDVGNLTSTTDARGIVLNYVYDVLNRKTEQRQTVSGGSALVAAWAYDSVKKGQLTSSTSYVGSTATANGAAYVKSVGGYDAQYNPTSVTISIPAGAAAFGGTSYTTTNSYTRDGSLASTIYPAMGGLASERVRYSYGALGRLSSLGTYDLVTYTPLGQPSQDHSTKLQDIYRGYGYDQANGRVTSIVNTAVSGSNSVNLSTTAYTWDDGGNLSKQATTSDSASTDTQCFKYSFLATLTQAFTPSSGACTAAPTASGLGGPAPYWIDYSVAATTGNRLSTTFHAPSGNTTTSNYSYPAAGTARPHGVTQVQTVGASTSSTGYAYDAMGNTSTRGAATVSWNAVGKVATIVVGTVSQSNVYDADGSLLLQSDSVGTATLFAGVTELRKSAATVTATRTYVRDSTPIAERSNVTGSEQVTWLLSDAQSTVTGQVTDDSGTLSARRQDPFGSSRGGSPEAWASGHGFLNAPRSSFGGLTQLGTRLYDATTGRFLSVDPVLSPFNPQQNDGYAYGGNAPTNNADPSGNCYLSESGDGCAKRGASSSASKAHGAGSLQKSKSAPKAPGNRGPSLEKLGWWLAGFNQDKQGILRTRAEPLQLLGGYNDPYDAAFKAAGTGAVAQKYEFGYGDTSYVVWMWKGEYINMGYGSEVGFYSQKVPLAQAGFQWNADSKDPNLPLMSTSVDHKTSKVASFAPSTPQVWVGAWNPNMGSWDPANADANAADLHARATVTFPNADVYNAFRNSASVKLESGWAFDPNTNTASIDY